MTFHDLDPQLSAAERTQLLQMAAFLQAERPTPQPAFRGELGRAVVTEAQRRHLRARPERLWLLVTVFLLTGLLLLVVAASQV